MSIKNDGHYFCRAGGNRPDGLNEPVTAGEGSQHITRTTKWRCQLDFYGPHAADNAQVLATLFRSEFSV
ncbi:phage neck terminator protein, partial [Escherichia coli]|uniref:phage neck terminator protein n=1 Tax=Escherichia coli TaxID=562 RepID=UPI003DA924CA